MRLLRLKIREELRKWLEEHKTADEIICDKNGYPIEARYKSPYIKFRDIMRPDWTVDVPDMEYYNNRPTSFDTKELIDALKDEDET